MAMDGYEAGKRDALSGDVEFRWSDMWSEAYRNGVSDALASIGYVVAS